MAYMATGICKLDKERHIETCREISRTVVGEGERNKTANPMAN